MSVEFTAMSDEIDPDAPDSKLTRSKKRWAEEGRFLTGTTAPPESQRLPPGQHQVRNWPVLDLGVQPQVSHERWQLKLFGAVEHPAVWTWEQFLSQPQSQSTSDIHCVTTWSRYDNHWDGVATRDVLVAVQPRDDVRFVVLHSHDGYTTNMALDDFASPHALLAHRWEGEPLTAEHGGPARLVVPHLYFWKSAKWIRGIEFRARDARGYWEVRGYHNHADPWKEERYSDSET